MSATFDGSCLQDRRSSTLLILVANTNDGFGGGGSLYSAGGLVTLEYSVSGGLFTPGDNLLRDTPEARFITT